MTDDVEEVDGVEVNDRLPAVTDDGGSVAVNPSTGEVVMLDGATNELAQALDESKQLVEGLREFQGTLRREVLARMDHAATFTYRGGGFHVSGDGPRQPTHDGEQLHEGLQALVDQGVIAQVAMDNAVEVVPTYKVKKAGVNALAKSTDERVQQLLAECQVEDTRPRQVRVKPS